MKRMVCALAVLALGASACAASDPAGKSGKFLIVATVSPVTDIVRNVAGDAAEVTGIIPEGVDSHTFEPTPASARILVKADLVVINGLRLEDPTLALARANLKDGAEIFLVGDATVAKDEFIYDFSFPKSEGNPNPHLWVDPANAERYARAIRDRLVVLDPTNAATYRANTDTFLAVLARLDAAIAVAVETIPPANRVLLTYHDSFAYFARHYGMRVIGAIQPADFAQPSAREVAALIAQVKKTKVPAIFGSEVYPSPVLAQIARESGARYEASLRDDDLPGDPGDPQHSYVGMMVYNVTTMVNALGGNPEALADFPTEAQYD
ncbi:MAG: metal ABC transporter substrate-binding protein [Actinomycetota bacterium]